LTINEDGAGTAVSAATTKPDGCIRALFAQKMQQITLRVLSRADLVPIVLKLDHGEFACSNQLIEQLKIGYSCDHFIVIPELQ
jgi:fructose/tagatose bisphosphate aldolase